MRFLFTLFIILVFVGKSLACTCVAPKIEDDFEWSDAVFKGKVISVEVDSNNVLVHTFLVEEIWKGKLTSIEYVFAKDMGVSCDATFSLDSIYIIFARGYKLYRSTCSNSTQISYAQKELAFLGKGKKVIHPSNIDKIVKSIRNKKEANSITNEPKEDFSYKYIIAGFIGLIILIVTFYLGRLSQKS
jgi:hypothetical protein